MRSKHDNALLLNAEIVNVITIMRQVPKWALIPKQYSQEEEEGDEPLLEELKSLRRKVFVWEDWGAVEPLEYLLPFLEIIKSAEISGPVTGAALAGLQRLLNAYILGESAVGRAEAVQAVVEAVTACKYESTDAATDEVVLFKILQVLLTCMKCPGALFLTDDHVKTIFEACYRIGQLQSEGGKSLLDAAQQAMQEITTIIFSRLHQLSSAPLAAAADEHVPPALANPEVDTLHKLTHGPPPAALPSNAQTQHQNKAGIQGTPDGGLPGGVNASVSSLASMTSADAGDLAAHTVPQGKQNTAASHGIVSVAPFEGTAGDVAPDVAASNELDLKGMKSQQGYGLPCITTVFEYIINLIGERKEEDVVFGLTLCLAALNAGGSAFERHKRLLDLVNEHLCQNLFEASRVDSLACLSRLCQITLLLYCRLRQHLLLQLEAIIGLALLRIAEGKGRSNDVDMQEAALEGLLDLVNQPNFVHDMFVNLDCRIERSNIFENICALLSKTAFPVNSPLRTVHLLSLDGLFAILSTLAARCHGPRNMHLELHNYDDPEHFVELWDALCQGQQPPIDQAFQLLGYQRATWADTMRMEKYLKGRLAVAADHFNRDPKKGFQFLQSINLLPAELSATSVAKFLRSCPGLSKPTLGELLGEAEDFYLQVLEAYTHTFDFTGMRIDSALRTYLETFRLPGEAQKINRIMESFGKHYHEMCPGVFKHSDAVYVLAYSVIMLNTDLHNDQVKTKMTVDEFIRNNRGINGGEDLPVSLLRSLYDSIRRNEIKIYTSGESPEVSPVFWTELLLSSRMPRGQMVLRHYSQLAEETGGIDRDMFSLIWGPTLAAVSVVLDHSTDPVVVKQALEGLKLAAKMASHHQIDQVIDSMVTSLSKFTLLLHPASTKPVVAFGEDTKAQAALETIFYIANMYGDSFRGAWRSVMDIVMRLHRLDLLPPAVFVMESDDIEAAKARIPRPVSNKRSGSSGSLISRAISSLISIDQSEHQKQPTPREVEATQRTLAVVEGCKVDEVFADSKFLLEASLVELVAAVRGQAGGIPPKTTNSVDDLNSAEVCLELLVMLALRNRDRVLLIWPRVHEMLAAIMDERSFRGNNPLVERAVFGLLRVCKRLLPYKEDVAEALLKSLKLICRLNANVAWELAEPISAEVLALLKNSASYIRTADGWNTVCLLLTSTSIHPEAAGNVFEALGCICGNQQLLNPINFPPCLDTALRFIEQYSKDASMERSIQALHMLEGLFIWLLVWKPLSESDLLSPRGEQPDKQAQLEAFWWSLVQPLTQFGLHESSTLRNSAIEVLKRVTMSSESLNLSGELWLRCLTDGLTTLVGELAGYVSSKSRAHREADKSLRLAVMCLTKTVLQYLPQLLEQPRFSQAWSRMLVALQSCTKNQSEELAEAVPECVKNMLLVMAAKGVLVPDWKDAQGVNLWDLTWSKAKVISQALTPSLLATSRIPGFEPAPLPPAPIPQPIADSATEQVGAAGSTSFVTDAPALASEAALAGVSLQANDVSVAAYTVTDVRGVNMNGVLAVEGLAVGPGEGEAGPLKGPVVGQAPEYVAEKEAEAALEAALAADIAAATIAPDAVGGTSDIVVIQDVIDAAEAAKLDGSYCSTGGQTTGVQVVEEDGVHYAVQQAAA